jgi:hypothetical protein
VISMDWKMCGPVAMGHTQWVTCLDTLLGEGDVPICRLATIIVTIIFTLLKREQRIRGITHIARSRRQAGPSGLRPGVLGLATGETCLPDLVIIR